MTCVNRNSKEFKFLAEHNNLSINALELITHKYWSENKTEDYFPSDVYIQAQLGKVPYEEPTKAVRELWDLKYKDPQEFASLEALEEARKEALRYFPEEAVTYHTNFKGNYILTIRKPLARLSLSISDLTGKDTHDGQEQADFNLIVNSLGLKNAIDNTEAQIQQEMADIKAKAIADETFMKAPNGKPTNLNEKQWLQVRTKAFKDWFGDWINDSENASKVVDENGEPKVVYHGSKTNITIFDSSKSDARNELSKMIKSTNFFSDDRTVADAFAKTEKQSIANAIAASFNEVAEAQVEDENEVWNYVANSVNKSVDWVKNFWLNELSFEERMDASDGIMYDPNVENQKYQVFLNLRNPIIIDAKGERADKVLEENKDVINNSDEVIILNIDETVGKQETATDYLVRKSNQIKSATANNGMFSTENDDIQMAISSPQTFTFKDGTTVKAPFKPNYQQEDALNAMDEFINSNRTSMTLSGYAGTGKTSLMEMLAEKMRKQYKPVMFCASTNKAAAVLKERVSKSGFEAQTLNKVFGITVEVDPNKSYNAKNLVNKLKDVDIPYGTTVIIDEASMINEENYNILNNIAKNNGLKIIYVGDAAQLAPVNETKISKVFRDQNHEVRTLSIVERTGDNAILKEATDLRNGKALSGESSFNSKGQGVAYLKPSSTQEREAIIKRFIPELKSNPNYFRILAYTNAAVAAYNTQVRQLLGYNDNIPRVGEPITGYANWGYNWKTKSYKFINSEAYKVVEVNSPKKARISLSDGSTVTMQAVPITLENSLGERDTFNLMDIKGNLENRRIATQLANMKSQLWNKARGLSGKAKAPILQQINAIDEFLFVNDNITEGERTLQAKVFDFGYAMTVHKSQGSTFTHVLMDDVDINKAKDERNIDMGLEDIAVGWEDAANNEPVTYEVAGPMEDIDMGDWEDEAPTTEGTLIQEAPKAENPNAANIRQQLKYVAVSRATDTVTIISDNVKKEDTPLNHINEAPASQEATQQKPVEQMSSTEVWRYLSAMQPLTKRSQVEYTPKGQERQTYIVENGHIYNSKGTEVYPGKTVHKNMILANHAVKEGLAIVVEHPTSGEKYVVDNNQQITSVRTGKIMEWGEENGDRRKILAQAEKEFRERITATKERGNTLNEQMLDQLKLIGLDLHYEDEMAQYLREHGNKAIQQAIAEQQEMQDIKVRAIADGTFMKAPNGKDTNLTERQWLQVRTKAFKKWFGDWEKLAPKLQASDDKKLQDILQNIANSNSRFSTLAKFILDNHLSTRDLGELLIDKDFPLANQQGWYREIDDPQVGIIRYIGFQANNVPEETFNGAILHEIMHSLTQRLLKNYKENPDSVPENIRASIKDLYNIIDYSKKYILDNYNLKEGSDREKLLNLVKRQNFDKGYLHKMFYAFDETANPESKHIDEFISEIFTNPAFQEMLNSIPYKETKQTLWDKIKECIQNIFGIPINRGSVLEEALKASTEFITKAKEEYDSVSKVVDENGEPLVVHRTNHRKFNGTFENGDVFFSSDKEYTEPYARGSEEANSVSVFLNIRTPLDNRLGNYSDYGKKAILQRTGETVNAEDYEIENKNVEEWRNNGLLDNKDGIIGNDKKNYQAEINGEKSISDGIEFVVFSPNQIKSATDNNGMFSENPDIQMFIGKKARTQFEQQLMKARPDMSNAEIQATLDFLHSLEDNKENTAYIKTAIRWIANRSITLPQDQTKAYQAFELARKKHLDLQKYSTLGELITAPEMQPKEKEKAKFNPDEVKTFSNKRTVTTEGGRVFTVYDIENTEKGQRDVCKALAAYYEMSPWCLSTFTAKGEPTESAKRYWNLYKALPRKIAFENGKPVAFNSDKYGKGIAETLFRGTPIIVQGEEAIIDSTERGRLSRGTIDAWKQGGLITESKIIPNALRLTEEAKKEIYNITGESWWDMEDTHPQDTLSDSIVSEPRKYGSELPDGVQLENDDFQADWENMADLYDETEFGFGRPGGNQHPLTQEEIDELPFFLTPDGEVYGFVDPNGDIYLDETKISPEHPIHEYTHLWDRVVAKNNPELWHRGITLMKQISLWKDIENDENYGQKWKALKGMTPKKLESLIASEVHSRLVGVNGEQILDRLSKEKGQKGIIGRLKQWLLDFWKDLKGTFSNWSQEDLDKLTLQDFTMMTIRDLADGFNPNTFQQAPVEQQSVNERINNATQKHQGNWSRQEAQNNPRILYVFTDNTDRDSGSGKIPDDSWYSKKYGKGHHFPTMTAAVVRGLDNARPISTQRWYHQGAKGTTGRWIDANVEEFKSVIRAELQDIVEEFNTGKYDTIMFPDGDGLFNTSISNITKARTPKLYQALADLLHEYGFDSLIPNDVKFTQTTSQAVENTSPVTKIISGGQTGVDTIGLQVAKSLGIETGGKAPKGFLRERGIDNEDIASYGLTEITDEEQADYTSRKHKSDPYTGRTELNVRNSDGTVYFYNPEDKAGYIATKRAADEWNKPFIENPTAEELRKWIENNGIHTLNVAGNRGTKLKNGKEVASIIRDALTKTWSQQDASKQPAQFEYARNANGKPNYEVSSRGDKRFSAMTATFAPGTTLFGHDVSGRTIESVYQHGVKQGDWVTNNNSKTGAPKDKTIITGNTENDSYTQGYLPLWQEWARQNPQLIEELRQKAQGKVITDMFASTAVSQARALADILNSTINQNNNRSNNKIEYGNDFRRIQETVRRDSQGSSVLRRDIGEDSRRRLARITKLELNSNTSPQRNSQWTGVSNKGVHYNIIGEIPAQLFHDIFEVVRYYTVNGELVDLHDDYSDCKCYLSDDGTCGFAIEPDGNLVSVFNLGLNRGFLSAIKDIAIAQGANHLDAFDSNVQPLRKIYEHTLGAKVASSMDYNMEYDHDNIAANHGNPQVVFMVMGKAAEGKVEEKHFNKDQYDKAQAYQQSFLPTQQQPAEEPLDTSAIFQNPSSTEVTVEDKMKPWRSDPSKQNISRRIYLKGHKDKGYFEVVKDFEDGYYSVHFKPTDSSNPNAFSKEEKEILFQAIADTIPVDGKLSTWGELSRGGIAGLERFSKLGFAKSGERTVTMKGTGEEVTIPVFTKYPDTTTRISLKGYEYFTDAYEDTLVDAPWKIPFLQELDRQFSTENPEGKNEEIVNQMKAILEAKSYEEWQNNTDSKTKEQVQKNLDEYDKLITQLNNLLDSDVITASEVRHVAELVVNAISDNITQLQKEKGLVEQQFPTLNSKLDFQTASRKDIINTIGINRLIHRAKLLFDPEANDYEDLDTIEQADLIIDNWDAIMTLASDIFAANEGVGISRDFDNGGWHSLEGQKIDYDNFNDYGNDPDAMAEETKDEQEHWQVEQRTIDILNSMSAMVRLALHECYQVDKEGNIIKSKWGIPERVNARNAVNSILRWTQGSLSLEDMITKLSAKQAQQPWLGQLIERLNDKSGNETDFQSQFYGVFAKHFQLYSVVLLEDGKYHSMTVNSHPALSEAMQTITTQFKVGEHPLFTSKGINKTLLGSNDTTSSKATFNLHKALAEMRLLCDRINHGEDVNTEIAEIAVNNIMGVCRVLGYPVAESMVSEIINNDNILYLTEKLGFIVNSLDKAADANKKDYDPFAYKKENSIGGSLRNFLTPITDQLEDTATNAFYDSGKMYQSYVTPSFMTKLLQKFRLEGQAFEDFLDSEYGNSEWFKFKGRNGTWRNEWLRMLATNEEARKVFDHKVELNFNKHNYMRNMSDAEYTLSLFAEYFAEGTDDKQSMVPAWFRIPMQSNKPSSEFIKFYSYRGANYKNDITDGMYNMFLQELSRIQTVRMRNLPKNHPSFIKNFDKNGKMFNFLPFLNSYLEDTAAAKKGRNLLDATDSVDENTDFAKILQKKLRGDELSSDEEANLMKYAKKAIYNHMDRRAQEILDRWEQESILEAAKQVEGVGKEDADVRNSIENYLWNDAFAAKNILQLTVGDIAFYKDAEDLQKRLAQLHAPGIRGNVAATDYQGNRVSDGYYRTFILQDFDAFRSNIIANITEVFDRKIARAPKSQKAQLEALKDSLVRPPKTNGPDDKGGKYWNINVTDAQGYSSPSSYRKKAFIFGKWSHKAEDIYQKLLSGEYNYTDLEVAFQPLKPFVYTHLEKHIGDGTPIETMNVPFQAKNSEYLLIMADAIMQSEVKESGELSRPNLLRAVYRVMEDSEKANKTKGIDTVQFESAIKSGLQGKMNIHQFAEVAGGEDAAYTFMMSQIYQNYDPAKPLNEQQLQYNTDTFVHEASFEDYCLQQEVPEHFKEHSQAHGSQIRMITPSDLDLYKDPNGNPNDENNINYYEWTEPDGTKRRLRADEFKKEYEQTIADNIAESIENLSKELHLDSLDKKERNIALSKILLREILSSPRYGVDLAQACAVDKNTGEFRIPKGDPIQAKRIEQLINSIIKNRVNKQKIAGGPIVQVTNFGTSKQLHIRFNARSGGLLKMESEFTPDEKYKTYDEYKKAEQAGIAYFEVFIPIWANEIFERFANEDGTIDVKAIEAIDPDLLKMISYRIPTEDKYSCAPMKAVGFMPREAGDAIMLPYELTEIDDSDFDVDKRYVMRKDIQIVENKKAIEKLLIQKISESYAKAHDGKVNKRFIVEQVKMYMDNPDRMKIVDKLMEYIHNQKQLIMKQYKDRVYKTIKPTTGKKYRDNKIVDMTWAVLTNEMTADKILNPGGFDNFKRVGYMAAAYRLKSREMSWEQLQGKTTDELNDLCYVDKDLTWADTQIQFYKQNAAAASLIGVFAVNKVAHATLEGDDIFLAVDEICGEEPFTIAGMTFSGRMQVDPKYDHEGNLIGKTLGSGVSASADAAKTPVLNLLNINMTTVGTFTSLLRLGMPHEDACLFIGQDIIARVLDDFNRQNLTGYASLNSVINKEIQRLKEKYDISENSAINTEPLTKEELIEGLTSAKHEVIDYKVLIAFQKAKAIADSIRKLSFPTRFNSISSAVGPLIIDNLILEHKMEQFMDENEDTHFYTADGVNVDITNIFADHPILNQFSKTVDIAKQMTSDMPAGSTGFRNLLNKIPDDIKEKLYNDKKLFSTLSDFYQSYLAIASGLVNPANLKSYIDGFPKWFMKENFKEKYPDNVLIQAIQMTVSKRTGRAFLSIKLTGEDETIKESYRNAWIDLHKTNPELSQQLFEYCFFRAGIGFSPKTFMAVVPTYVKERLQRQLPNGEKTTYLDTYRKFPSVPEEVLFDQFIANNWEDNKLVPRKGGKNSHFIIKGTELYATTPEDIADLEGLSYIKTSGKGETYLWKKVSGDGKEIHYTQIKPLGNNGEYLEISLNRIDNPMTATTQTSENNDASEIKTTSTSETDATEEKQEPLTTENKRAKAIAALAKDFMEYNETSFGRKIKESKANTQAEDMVNHPERFGSLMQNMLKAKGIEMSKEDAIKKLKELNLC